MATTEVILKENVPGLGAEADVVSVKGGYAHNFLVPQGKAYYKTEANLKQLNALKAKRAEREAKELNDAESIARKIAKLKLNLELQTGQQGKAFGSITSHDIADNLNAKLGGDIAIDHHKIVLERAIKSTGKFDIPIKLHPEVTGSLALNVKAAGADEEAPAEEAEE